MTETLTRRLARFAASLTYGELPPQVVTLAKALTLDTLGTALAATTLGEGCLESIEVMSALGGKPESSIIGTSAKVCAPNAAFANGALAHALNYDAVATDTGHTGVVCFTAPLAIAEARAPISGRRFLTAVAVAAEVTARVSRAVMHDGERHANERLLSGQYFGYFGAAAGAGHLLGLTAEGMHSAFGLAVMQVAGSRQVIVAGDAPAKAIYGAFPNHAGVLAALLAEAGLGAEIDALDGKAGFFGMAADGRFDADAVTSDLGTRFHFVNTQFKPWATSGVVTPFIEAAIELATRHDLHAADIASVEIVGSHHMRQWCEPLAERRRPANGAAAANSTLFATAKALAHRDVVLADFAPDGLRDPIALALTEHTTYRFDDAVEGGVVIVQTTDGRRLEAGVDKPLGHPARPMSGERLRAKFRDCCSYSAVAPGDVDKLIAFIEQLEAADDVAPLAAAVSSIAVA
jgi:2-methylcitrate dehydratase PrpD